jgi:hypothetical protein
MPFPNFNQNYKSANKLNSKTKVPENDRTTHFRGILPILKTNFNKEAQSHTKTSNHYDALTLPMLK